MSETKEVKVKKKKKLSKSAIVLIIGIAIIAIPCLIFAVILGVSVLQKGTPRNGTRFDNDLVNEISKDSVTDIETDLKSISNVEEVEVILSEGQLKVYIDTNDSLSEEDIDAIISSAYNKVTSKLPVSSYFTRTASAKMYDLQINVYTSVESSSNRQYKVLHKNSSEETYQIDDLVHPKDENLKNELEGKNIVEEEPEESDE